MNMKIVSNIYRKTVLAATVAFGVLMGSCTDYLTIIPADVVVEENFWQTKDQVNGMLATSYLKLLSSDAVSKAILWGDMRSDNMTYNPSQGGDIKHFVEGTLTDENTYCRWGIFYEAINYANLVIETADSVVKRDPDFTEGDLAVVKGEMYAMRALCHFYLVRTFRDIPLAMHSAKSDSDIPSYVQVHPMVALDSIMSDLKRAENMVMKSGAYSDNSYNLGRISSNAVLAMMADVNLWRAAFATYYDGDTKYVKAGDVQKYYDECVDNCRAVITSMDKIFEESNKGKPVETFAYNLIQNEGTVGEKKNQHTSTAYDEIFGKKNSSESIFELQIQSDYNQGDHPYAVGVFNLYGSEGNAQMAVVPQNFVKDNYKEDDLRAWSFTNIKKIDQSATEGGICITKYALKSTPSTNSDYRKKDGWDANWIIYRRTDVLLMMAEAMVLRESAGETDFREAFDIVSAINTRSKADNEKSRLQYPAKDAKTKILDMVRTERLLELSFEGKRWYDLVRRALIEKTSENVAKLVAKKLTTASAMLEAKMAVFDALFLPIHVDEMRYNKNLKQNPAYKKEDSSTEMN